MNSSPSVYDDGKEKFSIWKRMLIFLIDGIMVVGVVIALFLTVCYKSISYFAKNEVNNLNGMYQTLCEQKGVPYKSGSYGIYRVDNEKYIEILINDGFKEEEAVKKSYEMVDTLDDLMTKEDNYATNFNKFYSIYLLHLTTTIVITTLIFQFIVPISNKKHRTIGMMIFKAVPVDKENIIIKNTTLLLRFLIILVVELLLAYLVANWMAILFVALGSFVLISFTNKRLSIHDAILKIHLVDQTQAFNE